MRRAVGSAGPARVGVAGVPRARSSERAWAAQCGAPKESNASRALCRRSRASVRRRSRRRALPKSSSVRARSKSRVPCVQVEGRAVVVHGFRAGREEGSAAGAEGQIVGAAHGVRPAVVVAVRDAGDPGVAGADGGLDVVRGGQVADGPVTVPGSERGEGAQPGGRGGEAATAQVEDGERPLGERGGQSQASGQGVRPCARGAFTAEVGVSGERREHGQGRLQMACAVVLTRGVGLPQRVRGGGLAGTGASGPEVGVRTELHRLRHGHGGAPSPGGGGRTDGRGGSAGVVAEEQGGDPGVDEHGGVSTRSASPGRRLQQLPRVFVPPVERRHEPAQRPWRSGTEPVGNPRGLAQAT